MAAVSIGSLIMDLRASSAGLAKDVDKAMQNTRRRVNAGAKVAFAGATVAAGALAATIAVASKRIDELAKAADRARLPLASFQAYSRLADKFGVSVGTVTNAVQEMTREVSRAAQGTGRAVGALHELNLNARELNALAPEEQYKTIADALQGIENPADRARIAADIFGRTARDLGPLLDAGSAALDKTRARLDALGVTLSRVDAAKVEQANDAIGELKLVSEGATNQLAIAFAPAIEGVATLIADASMKTGGFANESAKLVDILVTGAGWVGNAFQGWGVIIAGGRVLFAGLFEFIAKGLGGVVKGFENMLNAVINAYNATAARIPGLGSMGQVSFGGATNFLGDMAGAGEAARKELQDALGARIDAPLASTVAKDLLAGWREASQEAAEATAAAVTESIRGVALEIEALPEILPEEDVQIMRERSQQIGNYMHDFVFQPVQGAFQQIDASLQNVIRGTQTWGGLITDTAQAIVGGLTSALVNMAAQWLTTWIATQVGIQSTAAASAAAGTATAAASAATLSAAWFPAAMAASIATFGAASVAGGAAFSTAMMMGAMATGAASLLAGSLSSFGFASGQAIGGTRAAGGSVEGGKLYQVNERGMEYFQPSGSGRVIPMGEMDRRIDHANGGPSIQVNQHFAPGVHRAELLQLLGRVKEETVEGILDGLSRGGPFRQAFQS